MTPGDIAATFPPPGSAVSLVRGTVMHARMKPKVHRFSYKVFNLLMDRGAQKHPWFLDDARDACAGQFDQVANVPSEQRQRILSRLVG